MNEVFPIRMDLRFRSKKKLLESLLVIIFLTTYRKNDIPIGAFLTNKSGEIVLPREGFAKSIQKHSEESPMDYEPAPDNYSCIRVVVETRPDLDSRIHRLEKFFPSEAHELRNMLNCSCNDTLSQSITREIMLPFSDEITEIEIPVEPVPNSV